MAPSTRPLRMSCARRTVMARPSGARAPEGQGLLPEVDGPDELAAELARGLVDRVAIVSERPEAVVVGLAETHLARERARVEVVDRLQRGDELLPGEITPRPLQPFRENRDVVVAHDHEVVRHAGLRGEIRSRLLQGLAEARKRGA